MLVHALPSFPPAPVDNDDVVERDPSLDIDAGTAEVAAGL
jgi:hypothetical protein